MRRTATLLALAPAAFAQQRPFGESNSLYDYQTAFIQRTTLGIITDLATFSRQSYDYIIVCSLLLNEGNCLIDSFRLEEALLGLSLRIAFLQIRAIP